MLTRTRTPAVIAVVAAAAAALLAPACGGLARVRLPEGDGRPVADVSPFVDRALASCRATRTMTADLGLSGRVAGQRIRGRILAGLDRDAGVRLEGVAPFGAPVFVLAGRADRATLVLPREGRVLEGARPAALLEAMVGVSLDPPDLLAALAGCPPRAWVASGGRAYGDRWVVAESADLSLYLEQTDGAWQSRAWTRGALRVEYPGRRAGRPERVAFRVHGTDRRPVAEIELMASSVEVNTGLPPAAFEVRVPAGAVAMTIDELRERGPFGQQPADPRGSRGSVSGMGLPRSARPAVWADGGSGGR